MENSKESQMYSSDWYDAFDLEDARYYGVFLEETEKDSCVLVDPERCQKKLGIPEDMKKIMDRKKGPLFQPRKKLILDYNVNNITQELWRIKREWNGTQKPFIKQFLSEIKGVVYDHLDDELRQTGIVSIEEAADNARIETSLSKKYAEFKRDQLFFSLYAQYFHQLAAQIDAIILRTLTRNGYEGDSFSRNILYAFKGGNHENIKEMDGFIEYDKMYAIWNFIKHNSRSTHEEVKVKFPEILKKDEYEQGQLACFFVNFSDELIDYLLDGVMRFLKQYCRLVFDEDPQEAPWNSEEHFFRMAHNEIMKIRDPCGLRYGFY